MPTCQRVPTQAVSSWHSGSADSTRRMRRTITAGTSGRSRFSTAPACQTVGMRPQVVAHRGASHENAEHTLGAYLKALEQGAEALECDVRLTADGHLVCVHDRDLRRIASTQGGGLHHGAGRPERARLRGLEEPVGRPRRRGARPRPGPRRRAHPPSAAGDRGGLRPAGRAGDRDQAPDALRRAGRAQARRDADGVRLARGRRARAGDELLRTSPSSASGAWPPRCAW